MRPARSIRPSLASMLALVASACASTAPVDASNDAAPLGSRECLAHADGSCPSGCVPATARKVGAGGCLEPPAQVACSQDVTGFGVVYCTLRIADDTAFSATTWELWEPYYSGWRRCTAADEARHGYVASAPTCP